MGEVRQIRVGNHKVGINGLDQVIDELAPDYAQRPDHEVGQAMMERLAARNYFPPHARRNYQKALVREFRRRLGQPVEEEPTGEGVLEIKLFSPGCSRCQQLEQQIREVLSQMGLAAELEVVKDPLEIARQGVVLTPALMINGKMMSSGQVPEPRKLRQWFAAVAAPTQKEA